jgi:hypothetical protein
MKAARFKVVTLSWDDTGDGRGFAMHATDAGESIVRPPDGAHILLCSSSQRPGDPEVVTIFGLPAPYGSLHVRGTLGEVAEKMGL